MDVLTSFDVFSGTGCRGEGCRSVAEPVRCLGILCDQVERRHRRTVLEDHGAFIIERIAHITPIVA